MSAPAPASSTEEASEFYDEMWQNYGHLDAVSPAAFHRRRLVVSLVKEHAPASRAVLDVGCGPGQLLREIAAAVPSAEIHGADVSEQSLRDARKKNPHFELFAMDLTSKTFDLDHAKRVGAYDLVICSEVLEHIPDHALAARRLNALLAPGGTLVVTVPGGAKSRFDIAIGHQRHYTRASLEQLLRDAQLDVVRTLAWGFPFHNLYRTAVRTVSRLMPDDSDRGKHDEKKHDGAKKHRSIVSTTLGAAYTVFGKALKPLYYLNAPVLGEQMIAVARKGSR